MNTLFQDIKYALRMLAKSPAFSAAALLTLALGIGGSATLFAVIDGVLLRPLPFQNTDRIVVLWRTKIGQGPTFGLLSPAEFERYRAADL
jgi:putative ABC transport system permease protein